MFDWNDLKVFLAAYREGSIGRAAEALGMSGSTVSRRLGALEEAVGQTLFVRTPEGLVPTDAGRHAHAAAEETERSATRLETLVGSQDSPRGNVRVSVSAELLHTVIVPNWLEFSQQYPEISIELVESAGLVDLERWEADIAVRPVRPASGDLVVTKIRNTEVGLFGARRLLQQRGVAPDDHPALEHAAAEQWPDWPWIDWAEDRAHLSMAQLRQHLYPQARVVLRATNMETMRVSAAAGIGLVLIPSYFGLVTPGLVQLPAPQLPPPRPVYMVGHSATRNTARVDAVWSYLVDLLRGDDERDLQRGREAMAAAYGLVYDD
ncbi:MAG: LysR family transcriptional regulator [Nannocystaceae bacterium]